MNKNDWISIRYGLRHTGYLLFENSPRCVAVGQRGAILPLVAIGMGALLAMGGLALDMRGRGMCRVKFGEFIMRDSMQFNLFD
jgi:hypothetical protein